MLGPNSWQQLGGAAGPLPGPQWSCIVGKCGWAHRPASSRQTAGVSTPPWQVTVCAHVNTVLSLFSSYIPCRDRGLAMAKVMGRKHMLSKVATAAAEGVDPRDLSKLKTKAFITTFRVTEDWELTRELKCSNCVVFYLLLFSLSLRKSWVRFSGPWDWLASAAWCRERAEVDWSIPRP